MILSGRYTAVLESLGGRGRRGAEPPPTAASLTPEIPYPSLLSGMGPAGWSCGGDRNWVVFRPASPLIYARVVHISSVDRGRVLH